MSDNIRELADKLRALIAEREECRRVIEQADEAKKRLDELNDSAWGSRAGEITRASIALRDAKLPKVPSGFRSGYVILSVDKKFITLVQLRYGEKHATQFRVSDGREKGSRSEWRGSVDVDAIVQAWDDHNARIGQDE